jgi:hypothetical protein
MKEGEIYPRLAFAAAKINEDEKTWKPKISSLQVGNGECGWPGATSDSSRCILLIHARKLSQGCTIINGSTFSILIEAVLISL